MKIDDIKITESSFNNFNFALKDDITLSDIIVRVSKVTQIKTSCSPPLNPFKITELYFESYIEKLKFNPPIMLPVLIE